MGHGTLLISWGAIAPEVAKELGRPVSIDTLRAWWQSKRFGLDAVIVKDQISGWPQVEVSALRKWCERVKRGARKGAR